MMPSFGMTPDMSFAIRIHWHRISVHAARHAKPMQCCLSKDDADTAVSSCGYPNAKGPAGDAAMNRVATLPLARERSHASWQPQILLIFSKMSRLWMN